MTALRWDELTRDEVAGTAQDAVAVLPVASIEQHGPHLPTMTDTALVTAIAERACAAVADDVSTLLAPTLCYGSSDHHLPFGGTLSLTSGTLAAVLRDLVRSAARAGCRRLLLLNGHGGNTATCRQVAADAALELGITAAATSYWELLDPPQAAGHAGEFETSLMLAVRGDRVRLDLARTSPGSVPPRRPGLVVNPPDLWQRIDGFTDDPRQASAARGEELLSLCADAVARAIEEVASQ